MEYFEVNYRRCKNATQVLYLGTQKSSQTSCPATRWRKLQGNSREALTEVRANVQVQDQQPQKQWVCAGKAFNGLLSMAHGEQQTIPLGRCNYACIMFHSLHKRAWCS